MGQDMRTWIDRLDRAGLLAGIAATRAAEAGPAVPKRSVVEGAQSRLLAAGRPATTSSTLWPPPNWSGDFGGVLSEAANGRKPKPQADFRAHQSRLSSP